MRNKLLSCVSVGALLVVLGCAHAPRRTPSTAAIAVRFAQVPNLHHFATDATDSHLTAWDADAEHEYIATSPFSESLDALTVTLWGGKYHGQDVTFADTPLEPGDYTFGFWDHEQGTQLKGWVHVNWAQNDLIDFLQEWKQRIPEQKRWLAYDWEIKGKLDTADSAVFKSFAKQLRAFDKLERELDWAIIQEMKTRQNWRQQRDEMFDECPVVMLPTGMGVFPPATQPVLVSDEVQQASTGDAVTKFVLMADAHDAQRKMQMVNRVCRSLEGCRAVLNEEVERLERRKRYLVITDHVYNHNRRFVENEMRIQQTLNGIDQLNEQIQDLRARRLALAFTNGLVWPDRFLDPLGEEERQLAEERMVLQTRKQRFDTMFENASTQSQRRVILQRQRQRIQRALDNIDRHVAALGEAQHALAGLKDNTRVIHRHADTRFVAAAFVNPDIPSFVREAVDDHSVLTVRIEPAHTDFSPQGGKTTATKASFWSSDGQ